MLARTHDIVVQVSALVAIPGTAVPEWLSNRISLPLSGDGHALPNRVGPAQGADGPVQRAPEGSLPQGLQQRVRRVRPRRKPRIRRGPPRGEAGGRQDAALSPRGARPSRLSARARGLASPSAPAPSARRLARPAR